MGEGDVDEKHGLVWKFGGSSLANADRINHVCNLIQSYSDGTDGSAFSSSDGLVDPLRAGVCSAMGKTTNMLLEAGV